MITRGLVAVGLVVAGVVVFWPGLRAGFVSDTFVFLEQVRHASLSDLGPAFVPSSHRFYRPGYVVALWALDTVAGPAPVAYHLVALLAHLVSAFLVFHLAERLVRNRLAAALAAFAFLLAIHAHEIVYDVADLHHALGGTLLLGAVLAHVRCRRGLAAALVALGMAVNELALLALPLIGLYEVLVARPTVSWRQTAHHLVPVTGLTVAYFALRILVANAGLPSEGPTCASLRCAAVAALEYANRLFARPERVLRLAWTHRVPLALATGTGVAVTAALLRPWTWRHVRVLAFAACWVLAALAFVFFGLWPYVSDRMFYVADIGLALLLGSAAAQAIGAWSRASTAQRAATVCVAAVTGLWLATGAVMLFQRGVLWARAGEQARRIVDATVALVPAPPRNASYCFTGVPDSARPVIPPGNTGPYVFRKGLASAVRLRYGRHDLTLTRDCERAAFVLAVRDERVDLVTRRD